MAATAAQISQLRRMVAEPTLTTYADALLTTMLEAYPLMDERGELPYTWSSATPPVQVVNTAWVASYDIQAAAADCWEEKAALWVEQYKFSADGGTYDRNQVYDMMMSRVRYHRSRRTPSTMRSVKQPKETRRDRLSWIGNLAEPNV